MVVGRRRGRRKWDRVVRTTKHSEESIDAAIVLAVIRHHPDGDESDDEVVCVSQYRPAVDAFVLELPAGLIDESDDGDPTCAAMRELEEETGFFGTPSVSRGGGGGAPPPGSYLSPGLTNESACLIRLDVDLTDDRNARAYDAHVRGNIVAGGDDDDDDHDAGGGGMTEDERERGMTTVLLPARNLLGAIHSHLETNTDARVFAGLYHLAVGMDVGGRRTTRTTIETSNAASSSSSATATATTEEEEETASSLAKEKKKVECDDDEDQQDREGGGDKVEEEDIGHDVGGPLSSPPGVCVWKENKQFFFFPFPLSSFRGEDPSQAMMRPKIMNQ